MLNEQEEHKLDTLLRVILDDVQNGVMYSSDYTIEIVAWLATKLKESNDKFKSFKEQIDTLIDKSWEDHWKYNEAEDSETKINGRSSREDEQE